MLTPFFRLASCTSWGPAGYQIVLGASGSSLYTFKVSDGALISRWSNALPSPSNSPAPEEPAESEHPAKRRKLSPGGEDDEASDRSPDIILLNESAQKPRKKRRKTGQIACISKLCVTRDGHHVVVVTNDDKTVRVLEMIDGNLTQISERPMPKKPNAVVLAPNQEEIILADKFGDVYSLPLLFPDKPADAEDEVPAAEAASVKEFKPAATELTVHTRKNLLALRHQLEMARLKNISPPKKKVLDFEHRLILGHVSLLTDIVYISGGPPGREHTFIITADRDEHIRVTRGGSQTHVIEGFCQGHQSFVNKILVPAGLPTMLISGGGDDDLFIWQWPTSRLLGKVQIGQHVNGPLVRPKLGLGDGAETRMVAVTGLYSLDLSRIYPGRTAVFVILEGLPVLISFEINKDAEVLELDSTKLSGNPLDVVVDPDTATVLVSIDVVHEPNSTTSVRESLRDLQPLSDSRTNTNHTYLEAFAYGQSGLQREEIESKDIPGQGVWKALTDSVNSWAQQRDAEVDEALLSGLYYGVEHMRKSTGGGNDEDEDEE